MLTPAISVSAIVLLVAALPLLMHARTGRMPPGKDSAQVIMFGALTAAFIQYAPALARWVG